MERVKHGVYSSAFPQRLDFSVCTMSWESADGQRLEQVE